MSFYGRFILTILLFLILIDISSSVWGYTFGPLTLQQCQECK